MTPTFKKTDWKLMSQRQRVSPFPNVISMGSMCQDLKQFVGFNVTALLLAFQDRAFHAFRHRSDLARNGKKILTAIESDPTLYRRLTQRNGSFGKMLVHYCQTVRMAVGHDTTAAHLVSFWQGFEKRYRPLYATYGSVWQVEEELNDRIFSIVRKRIADGEEASEALNTLTKQPSAMVARIEREALVKLAAVIAARKHWKQEVLSSHVTSDALARLIRAHESAFFWVTRDYEDSALNQEEIIRRLKEFLQDDPRILYRSMIEERAALAREQRSLRQTLRLTAGETAFIDSMLWCAHLKEQRKRYVSEALCSFDAVLNETARRSYLTLRQVRFLLPREISPLLSGKDYSSTLNERIHLSFWVSTAHGTEIITGKRAGILKHRFLDVPTDVRELKGLPVSPGVARGTVKIVMNPDECEKVNKGDVIVSVQVVPSFSAAILRSAALVCDGGHGITSHPAILAREAKIPCVIQTQYAREVLKDGDIVEVDGYKGIVRRA